MPAHVFISHSEKDKTFAQMLLTALEERGTRCWIAPRDIPPGGSYADAIMGAIEECSCFVLIYTAHSNTSGHVLREVERALKFGKNIVPVRFDQSEPSRSLDYLLATVHWLSVDTRAAKAGVTRAAGQIGTCLPDGPQRPSSPPRLVDKITTAVSTTRSKTFRPALVIATIFLLILIAAAAVVTTLVSHRKFPPAYVGESTTGKNVADNGPQAILRRYFACFSERDAAAAYNLLSEKFKERLSFRAFTKTFSSTRSMRLIDAADVADGKNAVTTMVTFEEEDADRHQVQWHGPVEFVREPSGWHINTMKDLKKVSSPPAQTQLPSAAISPARLPEHTWERPHIYLQLANRSQMNKAIDLKNRFKNAGYTVVAVEVVAGNVDIPTRTCELRYFTPGDSAEAQRIAHEIEPFLDDIGIVAYIPAGIPYVSHARQYEIWLSSALR